MTAHVNFSLRSQMTLIEQLDTSEVLRDNQELVLELLQFKTFRDLRSSSFFNAHKAEICALLDAPRIIESETASARLQSFLRVVEWNIERGVRLEGIIAALNTHPLLRYADLLLLNELDIGMARSANIDVPLALSRAIDANAVFGTEYLELTKGTADELDLPGENSSALHGNAILSRYPILNPQLIRLPRCENNFESAERRIGGRLLLIADLAVPDRPVSVATTHLDVVNSPRCRGRQMRAALQAIESHIARSNADQSPAVIVGGDLNTHTFSRGGRLNAIRNTLAILAGNPERLKHRLRNPEKREPAVREFRRFGYGVDRVNDRTPTSRSVVSRLDDSSRLPWFLKSWVRRRVGPEGVLLEFRLDWLGQKRLGVLEQGEIIDSITGEASVGAQTISGLSINGQPLSDHDPILVDLSWR
jgi:endonuclease/exonuclease/phosphatase family metal-dependent hydrolase